MANLDGPKGFFYHSGPNRLRHYDVDSSNATAIFVGDAVTMEDDGNITPAAAGGVIMGISNGYLAVSTAGKVPVFDDPQTLFWVQTDGAGTAIVEAAIGNNCDHIAGAGSADTLRSGHEIDESEITAATAGFRIIDKVNTPGNAWGANCKLIVKVNEHFYQTTTGI